MQIMPFDGGAFLMWPLRIMKESSVRRPRLILPGEKLSSVITSSLHVVGRGRNSGRGFTEKKKVEARMGERKCLVRAALQGPADQQLEGLSSAAGIVTFSLGLSFRPNQNQFASKCFSFSSRGIGHCGLL